MSNVKEQRQAIQEAIHHAAPDELDEGVCIGWVIISEWVAPSGKRMLARLDSDAGHQMLPPWIREGYLWDGLQGPGWEHEEDD